VLPAPPNTEVWIAPYVQVHQADKAVMRNIELDKRRGQVNRPRDLPTRTREQMAEVRWSDATLDNLLQTTTQTNLYRGFRRYSQFQHGKR
jgi:hypothetical protein